MACNIEIKAKIHSFGKQERLAASLADGEPEHLVQVDTFFNVRSGRLKLREFANGSAELLQYDRPNATEPTACYYTRYPVDNPAMLKEMLTAAIGRRAVVRKERTVYLVGQTRIHLDRVDGLGEYIELEVVFNKDDISERGVAIAHDLMSRLEIREEDLVEGAYVDLIKDRAAAG